MQYHLLPFLQTIIQRRNSMSERYQKSTHPDGETSGKSFIGVLWASMRERLSIGSGGKKSAFRLPDIGSGYQTGFESGGDQSISRNRTGGRINPVTGTYYAPYGGAPSGRMLWPWIVMSFVFFGFFYFALSPSDAVYPSPSNSPNSISAMADDGGQAADAPQTPAASFIPLITPRPTPSATQTPAPTPTPTQVIINTVLKYGSKGEDVKILQARLIELGYMPLGSDDGEYGGVTKAAVESFQQVNGLVADGYAGEKTLAALSSGTAKQDPDVFVWAESKGKEYHTDKDCSGMKDPKQIKKSQAEKRNLTPCPKCN